MIRTIALTIALLCLPLAAQAQAKYVEGTHYHRIDGEQSRDIGDRIEVAEVFWYGCPTCYSFNPVLRRWKEDMPEDVHLTHIAASMSPSWRVHARAFYTAASLGVLDEVHNEIYRAIHIDRRQLNDGDALAKFFAEHGVDEDEFRRAYGSFSVETSMRRGDSFARRYRLTGVPSVIVAGKYRTDVTMAGGLEQLIDLIDFLVEKERRERADS